MSVASALNLRRKNLAIAVARQDIFPANAPRPEPVGLVVAVVVAVAVAVGILVVEVKNATSVVSLGILPGTALKAEVGLVAMVGDTAEATAEVGAEGLRTATPAAGLDICLVIVLRAKNVTTVSIGPPLRSSTDILSTQVVKSAT
ncbi:MAG: hypothetical protein MMC23_007570 [Stictis urceolatum]|nr:hypothetical protein [Stictis urceolata]